MSRLAKKPLALPKGVSAQKTNNELLFKGPKGELKVMLPPGIDVAVAQTELTFQLGEAVESAFAGLCFAKCRNAIEGVTQGYTKQLLMIGVGYKAALDKNVLDLSVGFSHSVKLPIPQGVTVAIDKNVNLTISGINKDVVGQFAADVRAVRKPEPYKGKGIRYTNEHVRKKAGKSAKK